MLSHCTPVTAAFGPRRGANLLGGAVFLGGLAFSADALGAAQEQGQVRADFPGLHWIDWVVIGLYAASILGMGWWCSRRQTSMQEYFIGRGSMNSFLVGISLFATLLSTISYLSYPGEMIQHGPVFLCGLLSIPLAYVVVGHWLIPVLMRQRVSSAYQLLEAQLGGAGRCLGATLFILLRVVWMSVLVYMGSKALVVMMGLGEGYVPWVVLMTGLVSVTYTSMGGLRAVVLSDFLQFCLLFGGALLTVGIVSLKMDGFGWFPTEWASTWDTQPVFSLDPRVRVTVVGMILMQFLFRVCTAGGDQTAVQRYMATKDAQAARRSYLTNCGANVLVVGALALVGFALLGFYEQQGELLPRGWTLRESGDNIFPHFIANHLPVGISGLVVAAMFAAAMSSVDSGVNSITAVISHDFLNRYRSTNASDKAQVRSTRFLAFGIGGVVVVLGTQVGHVPGDFLEIVQKTTGMFIAPLFGLFFLALYMRSATAYGSIIGTLYGITAGIFVAYWDVLTGGETISFQYILLVALVAQVLVAWVASVLERSYPKAKVIQTALWLLILAAAWVAVINQKRETIV